MIMIVIYNDVDNDNDDKKDCTQTLIKVHER
jgi:hypothetical protein